MRGGLCEMGYYISTGRPCAAQVAAKGNNNKQGSHFRYPKTPQLDRERASDPPSLRAVRNKSQKRITPFILSDEKDRQNNNKEKRKKKKTT